MGFVVPSRFCGPPESGNGGWVCGHAAVLLDPGPDESVTVRLRTPPPLDRELQVGSGETDGRRTLEVADGEHPVAQATVGTALEPTGTPPLVSFAAATTAGEAYEGLADHPFPTCFSCGTAREEGDGLRLRPGRVAGGDGEYAADGRLLAQAEATWIAIDPTTVRPAGGNA